MSVSGIVSSLVSNVIASQTQNTANPFQKLQSEFKQLGQDLQSGNLSAAQSDFSTLEQNAPAGSALANLNSSSSSTSSTQGSNPLQSAFSQLSQDLQSGNLSGAQSDFSTIQQDLQGQGARFHHHHHGGGAGSSAINQEFQALGQALQSGNLSSAQQAYTSLQQDFQQFAANGSGQSGASSGTAAAAPSISVNA
ncbi:MAG TPA: hypothetical protein VL967_06030 [Terracidiphilus sp.]|nr:hypothetical protein [Terracidiphilus sp.]